MINPENQANRPDNTNTAGSNPHEVPPHIEDVPYDKTSLEEELLKRSGEGNTSLFNTDELQQVQQGEYRSERPPAKELPIEKVESPRYSTKTKVLAGVAGAALLAGGGIFAGTKLAGGNDAEAPTSNNEVVIDVTPGASLEPTSPTDIDPTDIPNSFEATPDVPTEAQAFVDEVGYMYNDPVSTYYAMESISKTTTLGTSSSPIREEWLSEYDFNKITQGEQSLLFGFITPRLNYEMNDSEVNQDLILSIYPGLATGMNEYMNHIAKNPLPEQRAIINEEFMRYFSAANNEYTHELMNTLTNFVDGYGSSANFKLAELTKFEDDSTLTHFTEWNPKPEISARDTEDGQISRISADLYIVIDVEVFEGEVSQVTQESIGDQQVILERLPITGMTSGPDKVTTAQYSLGFNNL